MSKYTPGNIVTVTYFMCIQGYTSLIHRQQVKCLSMGTYPRYKCSQMIGCYSNRKDFNIFPLVCFLFYFY